MQYGNMESFRFNYRFTATWKWNFKKGPIFYRRGHIFMAPIQNNKQKSII